ncbi:MAG TPA: carbon monoxide dehydrogenase [Dissulfurispiraceae bacterium]|nr:carbon monoxide dehydrogenase [Dissulfurispiraceae bacterium]
MAYAIAFAGKGGTGKTSLAGLTIKYLSSKRKGPILGVDADSNSCLNEALGVGVHTTVGKLREESLETVRSGADRPGGMSMEQMFDYEVHQSVIEARGFDLIVMGRPEGPGCYCAANNIIRKYTDRLSETYPYVVIDNEAGMEHLSRRTTHKVDLLIIVSDPTMKGILTAKRINDLVDELKLDVGERAVIINRVIDGAEPSLRETAGKVGVSLTGIVPQDELIAQFDLQGRPVFDLPEEAPSVRALFGILDSYRIP